LTDVRVGLRAAGGAWWAESVELWAEHRTVTEAVACQVGLKVSES